MPLTEKQQKVLDYIKETQGQSVASHEKVLELAGWKKESEHSRALARTFICSMKIADKESTKGIIGVYRQGYTWVGAVEKAE